MKIGLLGLIVGDLRDVTYNKIRFAAELGFHGLGAHLTVPAETISDRTIVTVKSMIGDQNQDFLQLWGQYPCIISPDESVRRAGVMQAREIVKLAAKLGVPGAGVRPTSLNPRGDWWPHPDNFKPETEDRFVKSLLEILETANDYGVNIILEIHQTTLLNTANNVRRVIERTGSPRVKVNIDPCNFIGDLKTAFNPASMVCELFDELGQYADTVHLKDYYLEDRFVLHIAETVIGTGIMDLDTVLRCAQQVLPNGYLVIEHLPVSLIPLAKRNLTQKIMELGIPLDANS
jgi:sugar phosphate isomerase/epimerase